ncbi:MAG: signal peptidase I [Lachnospiraceae bacterium]|nr:signal peptidase I [Lachnospiraceae bacterium]
MKDDLIEEELRIRDIDVEEKDLGDKSEKSEITVSKNARAKAILKDILSNSLFLLVVLVCTLLLVKYVGQRTVVVGDSMEHTLSNGDSLIVDKISYRFRDPKRFEIIVFPFEYKEETYYIKRIIGLPGETVRIDENGVIYINSQPLSENYGAETILDPGTANDEVVLGPDEYFVLGDNRNHSSDSRVPSVGLIKRNNIIGRAWVRIYPFNKLGGI